MGLKFWKEHVLKITLNAMKLPLNVKTISRLGINHCKTASHFRTTSVLKRQKFAVKKESSEKTVKMTVQPTQMVISALVGENVRVAATSREQALVSAVRATAAICATSAGHVTSKASVTTRTQCARLVLLDAKLVRVPTTPTFCLALLGSP